MRKMGGKQVGIREMRKEEQEREIGRMVRLGKETQHAE